MYHILKNLMNAFGIENVLHELPTYNEDTGSFLIQSNEKTITSLSEEERDGM
jgi:hypothetical protein